MGRIKVPIPGKPLKGSILAGQSNMQGQADVRTLAGIAMNPETQPLYEKLVGEDGQPRVFDNVWFAGFSQRGWFGEVVEKHGELIVRSGRIGEAFGKVLIALNRTFANRDHKFPSPSGRGLG